MLNSKLPYAIVIASIVFAGAITVFSLNGETMEGAGESTKVVGYITLVLTDENGIVKQYIQTKNAVHDDGFNQIIDDIYGSSACVDAACDIGGTKLFNILGIGTGDVDAGGTAANDLAVPLASSGDCNRVVDGTGAASTTDSKIVTISASFGGASAGTADRTSVDCEAAITEVGLFHDTTDATGVMIAGQTFSSVTIGANDILTVTWQITFS